MKTIVASLLFILLSFSTVAQTPVNLKLNLEKGKTYTVKSTSKQTMQQSVSGQQFAMDVYSDRVLSYNVLGQKEDVMTIEFKFDTVASKISSPMMTRETNSTRPGNEPAEKILNKMGLYPLVANISTSGKFIGFVNYGTYKDSVLFVIDSLPAGKRDDARKQADMLLKESALKSMIEPFFAYLPETSVNIGDTWETSYIATSSDIATIVLNSFTLKGVENKLATISGTSEIESMPSTNPEAQVSQALKGTSTFEGIQNVSTGLLLKSTEKAHLEGTMTVKSGGNDIEVQMKVDSQSETIMSE